MTDAQLVENISRVYKRISHAAMKAGRRPEDIKLIAVTKTIGIERIKEALDAGLRIFGESKVQEAIKKVMCDELSAPADSPEAEQVTSGKIEWHLIGHLQKNKAKLAVELFDLIHSIDSFEFAETIDKHAEKAGKKQRILLQVKLSDKESKHGIIKDNILDGISKMNSLKNLRIEGLMIIPPYFKNPEDARPYFSELRALRDNAAALGFNLPTLSMGMTNDFEVAIEEGATMVRIGTAIFGERKYCGEEAQ